MNENKGIKLNLSQLKKNKEDENLDKKVEENSDLSEKFKSEDSEKSEILEENKENITEQKSIPKLNLSALKPKKEQDSWEQNIDNKIQDSENTEIKNQKNEDYKKMKSDILDLNSEKKEKTEENENKEEENKELFSSYESDFKKQKTSILSKIKKLRNLPKTSVWFLIIIILLTATWVYWLFTFFPEKHNIENYKNTIMWLFWDKKEVVNTIIDNEKQNEIIDVEKNNENSQEIIIDIEEQNNNAEKKELVKDWFHINYELENVNWVETIKYKWQIYESNEDFQESLKNELEKLKKEKLSDFFKK